MDQDSSRNGLVGLAKRGPSPSVVARVGLGVAICLAGIHKLVAPTAWTVYVTDWLAPWLVVSPVVFMLVNGVIEVAFGAALVVARWTAAVAGVTAVSLTATVGYLAVAAALGPGGFVDVAIRDLGVATLAWAVTFDALRSATSFTADHPST